MLNPTDLALMKEWIAAELTAWKFDFAICREPGAKENVARLRQEVTEKLGIVLRPAMPPTAWVGAEVSGTSEEAPF